MKFWKKFALAAVIASSAMATTAFVPAAVHAEETEIGQWVKSNGNWYFKTNRGYYANGVYEIDGKHYWFNQKGVMQKGWRMNPDQTFSYFTSSGERCENRWGKINGIWHFWAIDGLLQTGFIDWYGKRYYCDDKGNMVTGWITEPNNVTGTPNTYYADSSGALVEGWKMIPDKNGIKQHYYFYSTDANGYSGGQAIRYNLARNAWVPLNSYYQWYVGPDGIWYE